MPHVLRPRRAGRAVLGLAAAALVATGVPTAHADDFGDIVTDVQELLSAGHADFATAAADFSSGNSALIPAGVEAYLSGVTNDFVFPSDTVIGGAVDALLNHAVDAPGPVNYGLGEDGVPAITQTPTDWASGVADAQSAITYGQDYLSDAWTAATTGDFADAVMDDLTGAYSASDLSTDFLLMGGIDQLILGL